MTWSRLQFVILVAGIGIIASVLALSDPFGMAARLEWGTYDLRMRLTAPEKPDREVVVIEVDEASLDSIEEQNPEFRWPWPHDFYGNMLRATRAGGARYVLFDFLIQGRDPWGNSPLFAEAIRESGNVVLACRALPPGGERGLDEIDRFLIREDGEVETDRIATPYAPFLEHVRGIGNVVNPKDDDGTTRRYLVSTQTSRGRLPSLGAVPFPSEIDGPRLHLRYYSDPEPFIRIRADEVVRAGYKIGKGQAPELDPGIFHDRIVLIGATAPGFSDHHRVPVAEGYPGVYVHATAVANQLEGRFIQPAPSLSVFLTLAVALIGAVAFVGRRWTVIAVTFGLMGAAVVIGTTLAFAQGYWVHLTAPLVVLTTLLISALVVNYLTEGRQRRLIKSTFQRYVSPQVVEKLVAHPELVRPGGERRTLTVLFCDLEGFTSLSEDMGPAEVVEVLNRYHDAATREIWRTEGTIDKYVGDAVVAFWGAPDSLEDPAIRACRSAWHLVRVLEHLHRKAEETGTRGLRARVGINTGEVVVGNVGSDRQFNYTVVGDEVNVASRLEGANKTFGTRIILSERSRGEAKEAVVTREVGLVRVVGKKRPIRVFELLGLRGETDPEIEEAARVRDDAWQAFRRGDWKAARDLFENSRLPGPDPLTDHSLRWCDEQKDQGSRFIIELDSK